MSENLQSLAVSGSKINRQGLPQGATAPAVEGMNLSGYPVSLAQFAGRQLLLVFSSPECAPCNHLAPQLEALHRRTPEIAVLMISRGAKEANQRKAAEFDFTFDVILQRQWEASKAYGIFYTPCAYLINEHGEIASDPAIGGEAILTLLRGAAILSLLRQ